MAFFDFRQNNSGGSFDYDPKAGISVNVIVEADNKQKAVSRAESIGLYFDGSGDCSCCGDRWSEPYDDGDPVPSVYGEEVTPGEIMKSQDELSFGHKWIEGFEGFIHYKDGRVEGFWAEQAPREGANGKKYGYGVRGTSSYAEHFPLRFDGWDSTGNRSAPNAGTYNNWKPPSKPVIEVRDGYFTGFFPTLAEAQKFISEVATANDLLSKQLEVSLSSYSGSKEVKKVLIACWMKGR